MTRTPLSFLSTLAATLLAGAMVSAPAFAQATQADSRLLTDPFLQLPTEDGVHVVWFTEFEGSDHQVFVGDDFARSVTAETIKTSRLAEDQGSRVGEQVENGQVYEGYTPRNVWRHEALVAGLEAGERTPYYVRSLDDQGEEVLSRAFSLAPLPPKGQDLRILLTSDHQLMPMTPANMQKMEETIGMVDAVFYAGDLQNIPDRASEWFDDNRGRAFFPGLQGNAASTLDRVLEKDGVSYATSVTYHGGEVIQNAPLFSVIGNHEVMGRYIPGNGLNTMFNDPRPRAVAEALYEANAELYNPSGDPGIRARWIEDNSYNTVSYEEILTLPSDGPAGERYYTIEFGDVYLIGLYGTRIWRSPSLAENTRGKFRESAAHINQPDQWGWGEFIFEDMTEGSEQYDWLKAELESDAFQKAKYKVVLMHHPVHGLGDNSNPAFADPVQILDRDENGLLTGVRYEYPLENDMFVNHIEPLLNAHGVQLVHTGHSHLWNRFINAGGVNMIETSNVGNNYGCFVEGYRERANGPTSDAYNAANYKTTGDLHGLEPIMPSIFAPMTNEAGEPLPCVASNDLTVFSVFETATGTVSSYVYDTRDPAGEVQKFDEFTLN